MASAICTNCNSITNSATSNYWMTIDEHGNPKEIGVVTMCYAAYDEKNNKWIKGCGYDQCVKKSIHKLIDSSS